MSTTQTAPATNRFVTGVVRLHHAWLFEPKEGLNGGKSKYSTAVLIPKTDTETLAKVRAAIAAAEEIGIKGKWGGSKPKTYKDPVLRDGDELEDEPKNEPYKGHYYINAKSDSKPVIVGLEKNAEGKWKEITDPKQVYSGMYGRVSITIYPFSEPNKGLAAGLNMVQKVRDGKPLSGVVNDPNKEFDDEILDEADDFLG